MRITPPLSSRHSAARPQFAQVAVDRPLGADHTLTYRIPSAMADEARVGSLVEVPLKNQTARGVIVAIADEPGFKGPVKPLVRALTPEYVITDELMRLGRWMADYYHCNLGAALATVSFIGLNDARLKTRTHLRLTDPARWIRARDAEPAEAAAGGKGGKGAGSRSAAKSKPGAEAGSDSGSSEIALEAEPEKAPSAAQARVIHALLVLANEPLPPGELRDEAGVGDSVLKTMTERGWLERVHEPVHRDDDYAAGEPSLEHAEPTLNDAQALALGEMVAAMEAAPDAEPGAGPGSPGGVFLLRGVTGSGKTEVYLRVVREALRRGRTAIMLVPEIALTPQTVGVFRARLGSLVGVYHSRMTLGQKFDLWRRIANDEVRVLIGARSAVFAPLPRLGVVVVDEEHESSYKQGEAPRYHARDVAVMRAARLGAVAILGSATPSMESHHNAREGKYRLLEMPDRIGPHASPVMTVIDMKRHLGRPAAPTAGATEVRRKAERSLGSGSGAALISPPLREAVERRLAAGEQVVLLLNRRGFANQVLCLQCEKVVQCPHCDVTLTYHKAFEKLTCHWCGHVEPMSAKCPACGADEVHALGVGTEKVEEALAELFPTARAMRVDVDTMKGRRSFIEAWEKISRREVDIILGTQMIAKGFHLESVTLVGVISADFALFMPDFRGAERTFQLLTQVAGRAGRGDRPGEVIVQSFIPHHYAIQRAARLEQTQFYDQEMHIRRMLRFPPSERLIAVLVSGEDPAAVRDQISRLGNMLKALGQRTAFRAVSVLGPAPAPLSRLKDQHRWRLLLRGVSRRDMRHLLDEGLKAFAPVHLRSKVDVTIDVDPIDLL